MAGENTDQVLEEFNVQMYKDNENEVLFKVFPITKGKNVKIEIPDDLKSYETNTGTKTNLANLKNLQQLIIR